MVIDVKHTAKLANLPLEEADIKKLESQLAEVLEYVKKLGEVDTANIVPTSQTTGLENVTREDRGGNCFSQEEALSNAGDKSGGYFKVKGIFEDE